MDTPPFCPNKDCPHYRHPPPDTRWFALDGSYRNPTHGTISRFRCRTCGRRFSDQTFSIDYMAKRKLPYPYIFNQLKSAAGIRDIARDLHVSPTTVLDRISRLARQALAVHAELTSSMIPAENFVADGFESFVISQYFPNNIHLLVGKDSQYLYEFDYAHLKRKGRMTEEQKVRNTQLKTVTGSGWRSISRSFEAIVNRIVQLSDAAQRARVKLFTDEKHEYVRVVARKAADRIEHIRISSQKQRTVYNRLFAVNYMDRQIRKDNANHVRETVQFSRNVANCMERMAVYRLYHNFMKPYRINAKERKDQVHGECAGVSATRIEDELSTVFTRRRFLGRVQGMSWGDVRIWLRALKTPLKLTAEYVPAFAWE